VIAIVVVVAVSVVLAAFAVTVTASPGIHADPVDPAVEQLRLEAAIARAPGLRGLVRRRLDRWSAGALVLAAGAVVLLAVAVLVGLLLDMIDENAGLAELDGSVADWGATHASEASTRVLEAITQLGARPVVLLALAVAAVYDHHRHHRHHTRRNREVFAFVAIVGLGEMLLGNGLKLLVERERPSVLPLVDAGGYSFPSGHSSAAAAAWVAVALVLGRGRSRSTRAALSGGAVLIAAAVATSRALLGVHWFTDVLAGLALGWGWYLAVAIAFGGRRQRLGTPVQNAEPATPEPAGIGLSNGTGAR
jgi:membrane-associated phospholipid phosphatase